MPDSVTVRSPAVIVRGDADLILVCLPGEGHLPRETVVARYDSLEALFEALAIGTAPPLPHGGYVRVHPDALSDVGVSSYLTARQRLAWFRLRLIVSPTVGPPTVELCAYDRPPERSGDG